MPSEGSDAAGDADPKKPTKTTDTSGRLTAEEVAGAHRRAKAAKDRGEALSNIALLDIALADLMKRHMIADTDAVKQMFTENGSFFAFGAKIRISYVFGLYDRRMYENLLRINRIRNRFAHYFFEAGYDDDTIRGQVENIDATDHYEEVVGHSIIEYLARKHGIVGPLPMTTERKFEYAILCVTKMMDEMAEGPASRPPPKI